MESGDSAQTNTGVACRNQSDRRGRSQSEIPHSNREDRALEGSRAKPDLRDELLQSRHRRRYPYLQGDVVLPLATHANEYTTPPSHDTIGPPNDVRIDCKAAKHSDARPRHAARRFCRSELRAACRPRARIALAPLLRRGQTSAALSISCSS